MTVEASASGIRSRSNRVAGWQFLDWPRLAWLLRLAELPAVLALVAVGRPDTHRQALLGLLGAASLAWLAWLVRQPGRREVPSTGSAVWGLSLVIAITSGLATMIPGADNAAILAGIVAIDAGASLVPRRAISVPLCGAVAVAMGGVLFGRATVGVQTVLYAAVLAGAAFAGATRGLRREQLRQSRLLLDSEQQNRAEHEHAAALAERARIAREIHDILAHSLADLAIQLEVADALLTDSGDATGAVRHVRHAHDLAGEGLAETRRAVHALRSDTPPLPEALAAMAGASDSVRLEIDGVPRSLPPAVGLALLRTAQEGLLNIRKHAAGTATMLQLCYSVDHVDLTISNAKCGDLKPGSSSPGAAVGAGAVGGHGLAGMRERLLLVGGSLSAGPVAGGWVVHAEAPG